MKCFIYYLEMANKHNTNDRITYDEGWKICFHTAASLGILNSLQDYVERYAIQVAWFWHLVPKSIGVIVILLR